MDGSPKGDDKGKKSIQNSVSDEASTLWSHRIRHSAVGLVSDAFGGRNIASALSSATSGEGKGEASGASARPNELPTWAQGHPLSSVPDSSASNASLQDGGFRSQSEVDGVLKAQSQQELDEFQGRFQGRGADLSMEDQEMSYLSKGKGKQVEMHSFSVGVGAGEDEEMLERGWQRGDRNMVPPRSRLEQQGEGEDGADVVALLSDPSFQPGLSFDEVMSAEGAGMDEEESPFELSPAEIQFIEKLRATLPPAATHKAPEPTNPLNLLGPLNLKTHDHFQADRAGEQSVLHATTTIHGEEGYFYTHATLEPIPGLEDWVELINSYHEDVWGYLKPYAQAAKAEVETAEERKDPNPTNGPAVRRLGMILAHLDEDFNRRVNPRR